ncbi:unnamed protein product [Cyclocybe aegerita]|uniref:Uncharacterized protein n=1 Tax=Cyclocybe aegerita TaxID=1973307 RepID=A0A8S0XQX5_CYCAE|nr:unnamed protein product [Cyclocybe aegerita]
MAAPEDRGQCLSTLSGLLFQYINRNSGMEEKKTGKRDLLSSKPHNCLFNTVDYYDSFQLQGSFSTRSIHQSSFERMLERLLRILTDFISVCPC